MKRKVNLVGENTLTMSLPSKWAKENNVKKGDELDIVEGESTLTISKSGKNEERKETAVNISKYGIMSGRLIGSLYKAGFDRIKINYDDPKMADMISKELAKGFIGMDIVHQERDYCILESMADIKSEELDNAIRRTFRLLIENAKESLEAASAGDFSTMPDIAAKDLNLNKYSDFSRRLLNKYGYTVKNKTSMVYFIVEEIEKIGDMFKNLCKYMSEEKPKLSKKSLSLFKQAINYVEQFYNLYYDFSTEKYVEFGEDFKKLMKELDSAIAETKNSEAIVLSKLQWITSSTFDLNGVLLSYKL